MRIYRILILLVSVNLTNCTSQRKIGGDKDWSLQFDKLYIYDNKSDTIIKNFGLFDSISQSLPIRVDTNPEKNFVPMPGSTYIETFVFYKDHTGSVVRSIDRNWDRILLEHGHIKSENLTEDIIGNIKINNSSISFNSGHPSGVITSYIGKIVNDTLYLTLFRSQNGIEIKIYPDDSFRIYGLKK